MSDFSYRLVTVDLDGTLTRVHGWRRLAQAFGREDEYNESNRRFFAHELTESEHLKHLLDLAVGRRREEIEAVLASTPLVDGIGAALAALRERGAHVALLTHNPEYVCQWYLSRFGFDDAEGVDGSVWRAGRLVDSGPAIADKLSGLARLARRFGVAPGAMAHIGDGWADAAIFPHVAAGIAFNSPLPDVEARADAVVRSPSLEAVVPVLEALRPRVPVNGASPPRQDSNTLTRV